MKLNFAKVYLAGTEKAALVAPMYYNTAGIMFEQEVAATVSGWHKGPTLGAALRTALALFALQERNLRNYKQAEWPSYRASSCRSVREFEAKYICIGIRALNDAELIYVATTTLKGEKDISLQATLDRYGSDEEITRKIVRLFDASVAWVQNNQSEKLSGS